MTSKKERLQAAIKGEQSDRAPVALWRHFPVDDQHPERLAEAVVAFQERYDFDFVKVTPASSFCLKGWGIEDEWQGATEGTRAYTNRVIKDPQDWGRLPVLDSNAGSLADQLHCLSLIRARLGPDIPIIQTIFNPLSQAKNLAGEAVLLEHLRRDPDQVALGLKTILESTLSFIHAMEQIELDGIFFATQHASYRFFDDQGYKRFGDPYDIPILEAASGWWLNVLHLHGEAIMFDVANRYPVQVVNWHDLETSPDLRIGADAFNGAVCGGIRRETIALGSPGEIEDEAQQAMAKMDGKSLILSTGCVVPIVAPDGNLRAVRSAIKHT